MDQEAGTATVWDQNRKIGQYAANEIALSETQSGALSRIDLNWTSLAAAGHNRKRVFRVRTVKASDRASALALDTALKRMPAPPLLHPLLVTAPLDPTETTPATPTTEGANAGDLTEASGSSDSIRPAPTQQ
jgi:hypothetical protein